MMVVSVREPVPSQGPHPLQGMDTTHILADLARGDVPAAAAAVASHRPSLQSHNPWAHFHPSVPPFAQTPTTSSTLSATHPVPFAFNPLAQTYQSPIPTITSATPVNRSSGWSSPPLSRQNSFSSTASTLVSSSARSPILQPTNLTTQPVSDHNVRFVEGDRIVTAGVVSQLPSTSASTTVQPQPTRLDRLTAQDLFSTLYCTVPSNPDRYSTSHAPPRPRTSSRDRNRDNYHRGNTSSTSSGRRTRSPFPYPSRLGRGWDEMSGALPPPSSPTNTHAHTDPVTSRRMTCNPEAEGTYPVWPTCDLCGVKPATGKLGKHGELDVCRACSEEALRAEYGARAGSGRD
jgi:hypothetical protein